ncbi:MAG: hypothetical protein LAT76_11620 [Schleiferiaceae bacterium]|nr:hypothetical protein [Schleiferiaceae bacterium]
MKKKLFLGFLLGLGVLSFTACKKENPNDPSACANRTRDFQECLSCCQGKGFSGASLPLDNSGNTTVCECLN